MIKMILSGCCGYMGRVITDIAAADEDVEIVAGIDPAGQGDQTYPVYTSAEACVAEADVLVDFSSPKALDALLAYCTAKKLPVIFCTTGYSEEQAAQIQAAAEHTAVMRSANMSLGINLLMKLLKDAARVLAPAGFDIEIVEKHHNRKVDAPSGTALALADSINEAMDHAYGYKYDRTSERRKREKNEIGFSVVRGGNIVGEHEVIFAGMDEIIEVKHTAYSRGIFAKGAVQAAKYMAGKPAGFYDMGDVVQG